MNVIMGTVGVSVADLIENVPKYVI